ncbi:MAG: LPS export ABC transporter periplasmic protein LptC [Acidobacteriia bacterium]|nr:LPS export ABC transporter periplasmic protein LptC [Terriglobia bacterium]
MPLLVSRLRRWFAAIAIAAVLVVAGTYIYARWRVRNALTEVPGKLGIEIQQTAQGFTVSRSEEGRTIFRVQASKAIQLKQGGITELHDVAITLYGRDSSRFDQIYGNDFTYNPQTGDVTAQGEVQIDLEANPAGLTSPDQAPPKELKNPIHLKTSGLVFNQKTGNAYTKEKVEFRIPQANGSAVGVSYVAKTNVLNLQSQVNINFTGSASANLTAMRGTITKDPRAVVLDRPILQSSSQRSQADQATLFLRPDSTLDRLLARGDVRIDSQAPQPAHARAEQLELFIQQQPRDTLRTAILSGDVHIETASGQPMQGNAGRVVMDFAGKNLVSKVHAEENVKLLQHQPPSSPSASAQDLELTAPMVDFFLVAGRHLQRAETSGTGPQIAIRPTGPSTIQQTLVTAGKFEAHFDTLGQLSSVHGTPDARIVTNTTGQPDRVSTSQTLDVGFHPGSGIDSIVQQGNVAYVDGDRKAWGDRARYTPADQMLVMTGSPRVTEGGMTTTARTMRLNRATGDAFADGDVKSTYSDLKPQPGGALLASSAPIHVTARSMTAHRSPAVALYTGDARLWQDANIVEAPSIQFDRDHRSVLAQASASQAVSTVLVQSGKDGKTTPITITSARLTYTDSERKAHFEGGVRAEGSDVTITSRQADVFLQAHTPATQDQALTGPGKIDHMVAQGQVVVVQPARRATGDQLVYTAASDQFVMTGGPPSIFDAEHGKITGVSLTFFRRDDRVLVEGNDSSPTVTHTRVAR